MAERGRRGGPPLWEKGASPKSTWLRMNTGSPGSSSSCPNSLGLSGSCCLKNWNGAPNVRADPGQGGMWRLLGAGDDPGGEVTSGHLDETSERLTVNEAVSVLVDIVEAW